MLLQATETAQSWEKRAQQLQQKYGKVDLAEHQRVQDKLAKVEDELAQLRRDNETSNQELVAQVEKVCLVWQMMCTLRLIPPANESVLMSIT